MVTPKNAFFTYYPIEKNANNISIYSVLIYSMSIFYSFNYILLFSVTSVTINISKRVLGDYKVTQI